MPSECRVDFRRTTDVGHFLSILIADDSFLHQGIRSVPDSCHPTLGYGSHNFAKESSVPEDMATYSCETLFPSV
jgi:hypothetical protein